MRHISRCVAFAAGVVFLLAATPTRAEHERSLDDRCRAEVIELHEFLEQWSNAELPPTEAAFARFGDVIATTFLIIGPDGEQVGQEPILDAIRAAHGRWQETPGRIRIENYRLHHAAGGLALATYEEWHDVGEGRGRLSTVLFGPNDDAPNGIEWLHLHEVWIDPPEGAAD